MRPTVFVLFGATGDLARRMVLPAFYSLATKGLLPDQWRLVGNGRGHMSDDGFRKEMHQALEDAGISPSDDEWKDFAKHLRFAGAGFTEQDPGEMIDVLRDLRHDIGVSFHVVHYFAIPPGAFEEKTRAIDAHGLTHNAKVIYEKPFGTPSDEFEMLDSMVRRVFDATQIVRIDQVLGEDAVLESTWNRFGRVVQIACSQIPG